MRSMMRMGIVIGLAFTLLSLHAALSEESLMKNDLSEGASELQDSENLIFLYMNGVAGNQDLAKDAYIINSEGNVLHKWDNSAITSPEGAPGYITPDGLFLRGVKSASASQVDFSVGVWGTLQLVDWDGNVVWEYDGFVDGVECLHHDIELMPNGNILATAFRKYDEQGARDEFGWNITGQGRLLFGIIYEIKPDLNDGSAEIVWEWKWTDHVIQERDPSLPNYGVVADHPGKIDLDYYDSTNAPLPILVGSQSHINCIDYHPERDEILFSSLTHDEIYIIDHSTTTEEAASSTGGTRGKGGDILYRWGNPEAYDYGGGSAAEYESWWWTNTQHDARWLLDGSGNITIHNNNSTKDPRPGQGVSWSQFLEIEISYDGDGGYTYTQGQPYGPSEPTILAEYDPETPLFSSLFSGGGQKLENGHIFTTSTSEFTLLEHDENGQIVWFFDVNDLKDAGDEPGGQVFKAQKYPKDYTGFSRLELCDESGVTLWMPSSEFRPGDPCACHAMVCNVTDTELANYPLFVILDVYRTLFFAPGFSEDFDTYLDLYPSFPTGKTNVIVLPEFLWPEVSGSVSGILFYGALTNPEMTDLFGNWDSWEFGWSE